MINYKLVFHNMKWLSVHAVIGRGSWLMCMYIIAYSMNVDSYGEFTFSLTLWVVLYKIFGLGLDTWINRRVAASEHVGVVEISNKVIRLRLISIVLIYFLVFIYLVLNKENLTINLIVFCLVGLRQFFENFRELLINIIQGLEKMKLQVKATLPVDLIQLVFLWLIVFVVENKNAYYLVLTIMIFSALKIWFLWRAYRASTDAIHNDQVAFFLPSTKEILSSSLPLGLASVFALAIGKIDVLMLKSMDAIEIVANYTFAYLFIEMIVIAFGVVRQTLFPRLSHLAVKDRSNFYKLVIISSLGTFLIGIFGVMLVKFYAASVMPVAYQAKFIHFNDYILLLSLTLPFFLLASQLGGALISLSLNKQLIIGQLCSLTVNIGLNYYLIPIYSGKGAIWATLVSYMINSIFYLVVLLKSNKYLCESNLK